MSCLHICAQGAQRIKEEVQYTNPVRDVKCSVITPLFYPMQEKWDMK